MIGSLEQLSDVGISISGVVDKNPGSRRGKLTNHLAELFGLPKMEAE
jgi:hypothetical protein